MVQAVGPKPFDSAEGLFALERTMRPYHPNNIKMTGVPYWRLAVLAWVGKLLAIQFHVQGLPFGGKYRGPAGEDRSLAFGSFSGGANKH